MNSEQQRILRYVLGAILSFAIAIALPFITSIGWFPFALFANESSAPVVIDGQPVFSLANTEGIDAQARARGISQQLQGLANRQEVPQVISQVDESPPTLRLSTPNGETTQYLMTVTQSDAAINARGDNASAQALVWADELEATLQTAYDQRQESYVQAHLWQVIVVPIIATLANWLIGLVWRRYISSLIRSITFSQDDPSGGSFTLVNILLNLTLFLVRLSIWMGALLYVMNLFPRTRQFSYRVISTLIDSFTGQTLTLGSETFSILNIFTVIALIFVVFIGAGAITNILKSRILRATGINRGVQEAIAILVRYSLIFIGSVILLQLAGLDLSSLTLIASALGVGIGLGLQNIIKDIGSGLVLVFERPIQVGEFISFGEYMGTVERIGPRSAEIRTLDQISIIVPNSRFLESEVINWSHRNPISRLHIPVGVAYKSNPVEVRNLLLGAGARHPDVLSTPAPQVFFQGFGDNALEFELLVWIMQPNKQFLIKSDLYFAIAKALHEKGVEIPFPQRDLHFIDGELPIGLNAEAKDWLSQLFNGKYPHPAKSPNQSQP
ncbi:mechanosensitive ion channel [Romeria aff. gracilis LEGE 07310]|uniref:Mechanosensitive ion channel n=1 Tax=Vasconcelosia minhoensis LEGE 07310 TaxID=915328 RepID=A0A8J7AA52_9CYAN|nr:mechanosensitive ion channel domain-containing protein [Romeria gracilis]MBE9076931.1 mechanosensitive ion channel [Romeria aff. gracilis LEGE 07310]